MPHTNYGSVWQNVMVIVSQYTAHPWLGWLKTCNHVIAALFRIEAVIGIDLNNHLCTSKPYKWLPNNKAVNPIKIKDLKLKRSL